MSYANNKGADQPAHPHNLISTFVVRCLDSVMSLVSVTKISSLMLASIAEQASLRLTWSEPLKTRFLMTRLKCFHITPYNNSIQSHLYFFFFLFFCYWPVYHLDIVIFWLASSAGGSCTVPRWLSFGTSPSCCSSSALVPDPAPYPSPGDWDVSEACLHTGSHTVELAVGLGASRNKEINYMCMCLWKIMALP